MLKQRDVDSLANLWPACLCAWRATHNQAHHESTPITVSQERYRQRHPGFNIVFAQRTATAFRVNTHWKWTARTDLDAAAEGDAQVWDLQRGTTRIRIANVYDQIRRSDGSRPSRFINWTEVINSRTVVAGDFNAHSRRWNPLLNAPARDHRYLEDFIDTHALSPIGDGEATCFSPNATNYSVIDLVLVTQEIAVSETASSGVAKSKLSKKAGDHSTKKAH
jgi:endonuclease/exonuclease/phosphatase family metal-dependent hydrolase